MSTTFSTLDGAHCRLIERSGPPPNEGSPWTWRVVTGYLDGTHRPMVVVIDRNGLCSTWDVSDLQFRLLNDWD